MKRSKAQRIADTNSIAKAWPKGKGRGDTLANKDKANKSWAVVREGRDFYTHTRFEKAGKVTKKRFAQE